MSEPISVGREGWFATARRDFWWVEPLLVFVGLSAFVVYSTYSAVFWGEDFEVGPYLSPFFEPLIRPSWWKLSPAILILWAPLGFRVTCYYYRGAYYKAFFLNPPACAVTGSQAQDYTGETRFPFVLQNLHRYFLYVVLILNVFLWYGAIRSFWYDGQIGIGIGSIVLTINAFLLMMYSFSCHSIRHLIGGRIDCFSCSAANRVRHGAWKRVSRWNERHRFWAWTSLIWVALTDLYVRLVAIGAISDWNTWGPFPLH